MVEIAALAPRVAAHALSFYGESDLPESSRSTALRKALDFCSGSTARDYAQIRQISIAFVAFTWIPGINVHLQRNFCHRIFDS